MAPSNPNTSNTNTRNLDGDKAETRAAKVGKSTTLIAVHSVQATDKDGKRVDIAPGKPFTVSDDAQREYLLKSGAVRVPKKGEEGFEAEVSSADGLPEPPVGYAPGTAPAVAGEENNPPVSDAGAVIDEPAPGTTGGTDVGGTDSPAAGRSVTPTRNR